MGTLRMFIRIVCSHCGTVIHFGQIWIQKGKKDFCSDGCSDKSNKKGN